MEDVTCLNVLGGKEITENHTLMCSETVGPMMPRSGFVGLSLLVYTVLRNILGSKAWRHDGGKEKLEGCAKHLICIRIILFYESVWKQRVLHIFMLIRNICWLTSYKIFYHLYLIQHTKKICQS